jgi:stabilization protein
MKFPFVGGSYQMATLSADAQRSLNIYPANLESGSGKSPAALIGTPGLSLHCTLPTTPGRGLWAGEQRLFAVSGSRFYEIFSNGTYNDRGDVGNDGRPVQILPNGNQVMIVSNGQVWIDTGTAIMQPTYPGLTGTCNTFHSLVVWATGNKFDGSMVGKSITIGGGGVFTVLYVSPPDEADNFCLINGDAGGLTGASFATSGAPILASSGTFLDGYFIVSVPNSKQFLISAINNGLSWDPLDFAVKEGYPDNLAAVLADNEEVFLLGTQTLEAWRNTGGSATNTFPLERDPGAVLKIGTTAPASPVILRDGIALLGGDTRGGPVAYHIEGLQPKAVSTHAIERKWKSYATTADAISLSYIEDGHHFWEINFPTADATWVYDATEKQWHERSSLVGGVQHRHRITSHAFTFEKHFAQDNTTGAVYVMSTDITDEVGNAITRQRIAPHISDEEKLWFFNRFTLDVEANAGTTPAPVFTLDWSNDGGNTYGTAKTRSGGWITSFLARLLWNRLGKARQRTFRVTSTAAIKHIWTNAYYEATKGIR